MTLSGLTKGQRMIKTCEKDAILLFGDSLTQRSFDPLTHGWGCALSHIYSRKLDVICHGYSGYNSEWCKHLLPHVLQGIQVKSDAAGTQVKLICIFVGTNDSVIKEDNPHQHVPLEDYKRNLNEMVQQVQTVLPSTRILLVTPPPLLESEWEKYQISTGRPMDRSVESTLLYRDACISVAASLSIPVVDLWAAFFGHPFLGYHPSYLRPHVFVDGLHFDTRGNEIVYQSVLDAITTHWPELDPNGLKSSIAWWDKVDPSNLPTSLFL